MPQLFFICNHKRSTLKLKYFLYEYFYHEQGLGFDRTKMLSYLNGGSINYSLCLINIWSETRERFFSQLIFHITRCYQRTFFESLKAVTGIFMIYKINLKNQVIYTNQKKHFSFIDYIGSSLLRKHKLSPKNDRHVHSNKSFGFPRARLVKGSKNYPFEIHWANRMFCEFKKQFQHRIYRLKRAHNNNGYLINYGIIVMENWAQMCKWDITNRWRFIFKRRKLNNLSQFVFNCNQNMILLEYKSECIHWLMIIGINLNRESIFDHFSIRL